MLLASPALAQETLPLRSGLGEVEITVTDGGGDRIVGASILLSGPTERQALSVAHGAEFEELPPGGWDEAAVSISVQAGSNTSQRITMRLGTVRVPGYSKPRARPASARRGIKS